MFAKLKFWKWRSNGQCSPLLAIPVAPAWNPEHAAHLKTFLSNPTGQVFLLRARALEAAYSINACGGKADPKMAAGFSYCLNWIESLCKISGDAPVQSVNVETPLTADGDAFVTDPAFA